MESQMCPAKHYDTLSRWGRLPDEANQQRVEQTLALVTSDVRTVLDLGCGDGTVSNPLAAKGLDVTGVDISTEALRYFQGKGLLGSVERLPFPDRSFYLVICAQVLEHLPVAVYDRALQEIERIATRYIIITTPNEEYLSASFARCEHCGCIFHADFHVRVFTPAAHRALFQRFELVQTLEINSWKHHPLVTRLEQCLLGVYKFKEGLSCPCCGYLSVQRPRLGYITKGIVRGLRLVGQMFYRQPKARWIASLYRCTDP